MTFLRFTICIASRRYTDNICLQDQVTGLSCSALSRFPQCHKQVCCMPMLGECCRHPILLPCSGTNQDFRGLMRLISDMTIGRHDRRYRQSAARVVPTCHATL